MTKNIAFHAALSDSQLASKPNVIDALNDLLAAGAADVNQFRQAILNRSAIVWDGLGAPPNTFNGRGEANRDSFLLADGGNGYSRIRGGGPDPLYDFAALTKLAAEKRVLFTLKEATEAQLEAILDPDPTNTDNEIRRKLFGDNGVSTFGQPQVTLAVGSWNVANDNIITNQAITRIKAEAERQLLIKKIAALGDNDKPKIDALFASIGNQGLFTAAVRDIFGLPAVAPVPPTSTDNIVNAMQVGSVLTQEIQWVAAKKGTEQFIKHMPDASVLREAASIVNPPLGNPVDFRTHFRAEACVHYLKNEDILPMQGQFAARYLAAKYANLLGRAADLERIAEAVSDVSLKTVIRGNPPGGIPAMPEVAELGASFDHAITAATLPAIRQAAAKQALKLKIAQCNDEAALTELISVTNDNELKTKLATLNALGYTGKNEFREALTGSSAADIAEIVAMAQIRKSLAIIPTDSAARDNHLNKLKELILDPNFSAKYLNTFAVGQPNAVQNVLTSYFADPAKLNAAREQAVLTYLEHRIAQLSAPDIVNLAGAAGNAGQVINLITPLFRPQPADLSQDGVITPVLTRLITDANRGVGLQIRSYAAAEAIARTAKATLIDLSTASPVSNQNHTHLLDKINNPNSPHLDPLITAGTFPVKEKQRVRASLVETLVRNFPADRIPPLPAAPAPDRLTALAKAADIDKFKDALRDIGVTEHDWVNPKTMEQIQKAAYVQLIKLDGEQRLPLGNENNKIHPKLIQLIDQLPLAQQRALLENNKAVVSLSQVIDPKEVDRILGASDVVDDAFVTALIQENKKLANLTGIPNKEVAKILAKIEPALNLSPQQITQISNGILSGPNLFDLAGAAPNIPYIQSVRAIAGFIGQRQQEIYNAFGLDNPGTGFGVGPNDLAIRTAVRDQETRNQHVLALYTPASGESKVIYKGIAGLTKSAPLSQAAATAIHNAIKDSKTHSEFIGKITKPAFAGHIAAFAPPASSLDKQLTPKFFAQMKVDARKQTLLDPNTYETEFEEQETAIESLKKSFANLQLNRNTSRLKRLAEAKPIYWFHPAFQGAAKENAKKMGSEFRELSENCDTMIAHLKEQMEQIKDHWRSLPSETDIRRSAAGAAEKQEIAEKVSEKQQELVDLYQQMDKELKEYESLQLLFKGKPDARHPLLKQGLLTTLKQAEEGKKDIRIRGFHSYAKDYPVDQKEAHFAATWQGEGVRPNAQNNVSITATDLPTEPFETVDMVEPGKFREYTVYHDKTDPAGRPVTNKYAYIKECGVGNLTGKVGADGASAYAAEVKLTANKFPPPSEPDACVRVAMEMATHILATRHKAPTADHPLIIDGPLYQIEYVWTALMAIGKNDSNLRFDEKAIIIDNAQFSPDSQLGMFGRWKGDSLFKRQFETNSSYTGLLKGIKEVDKLKFGKQEQKGMETAKKDTAELMQFYKSKQGILTGVKQKVKEMDDTIEPPPASPAA
ncbi:hypothetical protein [Legionella maceachernii]|uniref:Interaptin n=1 Tax=Legionella maceachernii TaxID=466 RepID=A0A0W0VWU0_9GAMM|nr:hypothetical protein [Legionella maceachernii]KTD24497.1 interaptin [Legionella maceachernii]SJZ60622.1 hypothetical protein SAMN02745128_00566 [Legionella maceachernii]SUP00858.1 Uncharacterised protein [Legionella maceachernii]